MTEFEEVYIIKFENEPEKIAEKFNVYYDFGNLIPHSESQDIPEQFMNSHALSSNKLVVKQLLKLPQSRFPNLLSKFDICSLKSQILILMANYFDDIESFSKLEELAYFICLNSDSCLRTKFYFDLIDLLELFFLRNEHHKLFERPVRFLPATFETSTGELMINFGFNNHDKICSVFEEKRRVYEEITGLSYSSKEEFLLNCYHTDLSLTDLLRLSTNDRSYTLSFRHFFPSQFLKFLKTRTLSFGSSVYSVASSNFSKDSLLNGLRTIYNLPHKTNVNKRILEIEKNTKSLADLRFNSNVWSKLLFKGFSEDVYIMNYHAFKDYKPSMLMATNIRTFNPEEPLSSISKLTLSEVQLYYGSKKMMNISKNSILQRLRNGSTKNNGWIGILPVVILQKICWFSDLRGSYSILFFRNLKSYKKVTSNPLFSLDSRNTLFELPSLVSVEANTFSYRFGSTCYFPRSNESNQMFVKDEDSTPFIVNLDLVIHYYQKFGLKLPFMLTHNTASSLKVLRQSFKIRTDLEVFECLTPLGNKCYISKCHFEEFNLLVLPIATSHFNCHFRVEEIWNILVGLSRKK